MTRGAVAVPAAPEGGLPPRENPFGARRIEALGWRPGAGAPHLPQLLARLEALGGKAAVVGPEGHGKTTLLDALEGELAHRGLRTRRLAVFRDRALPRGDLRRFLAGVGSEDFLLVDGAGHLRPWTWWRLRLAARRAAGLLVALHRPGLLPTLHRCTTTPELLRELVDDLLVDRQAVGPPSPPLPTADVLHARHDGDLRRALRELYDHCGGRRTGGR